MQDPIAYTYEADHHCPACAIARFGSGDNGIGADRWPPETARDNEGNPIGAVAPWDEWFEPSEVRVQVLTCADCGRELARYEPFDLIEDEARKQGLDDGTAAGSWVIDGNTSTETAAAILQGLDDGDPAILDLLPSAPLSGEYADGLLPRDVLGWYGMTEDDWNSDGLSGAAAEVLNAYEDGYNEGVAHEVERSARYMVPA